MIKWATLVCIVVFHFMGGCASKASDELLGTMCDNKLKVSGVLRGTVYEEEAKRITDEYKTKEDNLKAEMERDLKGMDDVLAGRLKAIESGEGEETDEQKEERIKAAKEDIEKKKKGITDQFEPLIKKLTPQRDYALNQAKEYVAKRQKEASESREKCVSEAKDAEVTEALANCRIKAGTVEVYDLCK